MWKKRLPTGCLLVVFFLALSCSVSVGSGDNYILQPDMWKTVRGEWQIAYGSMSQFRQHGSVDEADLLLAYLPDVYLDHGEVLMRVNERGNTGNVGIVFSMADEENYYFAMLNGEAYIKIFSVVAGYPLQEAFVGAQLPMALSYYLKLRLEPERVLIKVWPVGADEPEYWDIEKKIRTLAGGQVGVISRFASYTVDLFTVSPR